MSSLSIVTGESGVFDLAVKDGEGDPYNLTGSTLYFTVKRYATDTVPLIYKTSGNAAEILITSNPNGLATIFTVPADTALLTPGLYYFDIWARLPDGSLRVIVRDSTFTIIPRITIVP